MNDILSVKNLLVVGPGGSRIDFIAGWLGKLPKFLDTVWSISPLTGCTISSTMNVTKQLDKKEYQTKSVKDVLQYSGYELSESAEYTLATTCHGVFLNNQLSSCNDRNFTLIQILARPQSTNQLIWEYVIKTFLTRCTTKFHIENNLIYNNFPLLISSDADRKEFVHRKIIEIRQVNIYKPIDIFYNPKIQLYYDELFVKGGSYNITNSLNIDIDKRFHTYWDLALEIATSPKEIYQFGHHWKYSDYFDD